MRLFYALEVPGELAVAIADWRQQQLPPAGREVPLANFHITLAFLGEVAENRLEQLCTDTEHRLGTSALGPNQIPLDQLGFWPGPGIYWLGPAQWPGSLTALADALAQTGNRVGARRKRRAYQPHITLFRNCELAPPAPVALPDFTLHYDSFALIESRGGRQGVHYQPIAHWQL